MTLTELAATPVSGITQPRLDSYSFSPYLLCWYEASLEGNNCPELPERKPQGSPTMNTWVLKQKLVTWDHCKVFSSDRAFKVPLHRRFIWVVDGRSPRCVALCWTRGKGSIAVPRASAPICYRLGQRCRRGAWRCWCIPGLPRSIQCSAHTSRRVFTSSEQYAKLLFFLVCFVLNLKMPLSASFRDKLKVLT